MWDCETCHEQRACMTQVLAGREFIRNECNPPALTRALVHNTKIVKTLRTFLATHAVFTNHELKALGLNKQSIQYHVKNLEDAGVVRKVGVKYVMEVKNGVRVPTRYVVWEQI